MASHNGLSQILAPTRTQGKNTELRRGLYLCQRYWSNTSCCNSGHNRWSTIKHDKAKNDAVKNKQTSIFAKEIAAASKLFGPNPQDNPRLNLAITNAKKTGFPKTSIEAAIARGQGISVTGKLLENVTVEALLPPSIGMIIECQTEGKLRLLQDLKLLIKNHGGSITPTEYLFERKGRIVIHKEASVDPDKVFDLAVDSAALDVIDASKDYIVVLTKPNDIQQMVQKLSQKLLINVKNADIIWDPLEDTKIALPDTNDLENLTNFLSQLRQEGNVRDVYLNLSQGSVNDDIWANVNKSLIL